MSEWLTTGEMIDRLKVGEVAIPNDEKYLAVKRGMGGFIWVNRHTFEKSEIHKDYFRIDRYTVGLKWRILPRYVSFEEAMKAYAEGKNIVFYPASNEECNPVRLPQCYRNYVLEDLRLGEFSLLELVNGKWTIEE